MNTLPLIENSQLITNLAGSVAFEAILKGKPVISLGSDHHDILPYTMIRLVKSLKNLFSEICDLLQNYSFDEKALKCFIAASMKNSIKVNLYSSLLGRPNREIPKKFENNYNMEIEKLSLYTLKKIQDLKKQPKQL